ncbi:hypothetical protein [Streptomyces microflavus]|uniref:hypothetical protein n=1 Tax=Streptomyces microflavus TaxID=1919 RepID=UPI00380C44BC
MTPTGCRKLLGGQNGQLQKESEMRMGFDVIAVAVIFGAVCKALFWLVVLIGACVAFVKNNRAPMK